MAGPERLDSLSELGLAVLDDVALVEDAVVPSNVAQDRDVVSDHLVRHDDHVVLCDLGD